MGINEDLNTTVENIKAEGEAVKSEVEQAVEQAADAVEAKAEEAADAVKAAPNKLQELLTEAEEILGNEKNVVQVKTTYLRKKVSADAEDETILEKPPTEYADRITDVEIRDLCLDLFSFDLFDDFVHFINTPSLTDVLNTHS